MGEKEQCEKPVQHKVHMCKLRKDGKIDEFEQHGKNPIVFCNKCKAVANDPLYLCNPRALKVSKK